MARNIDSRIKTKGLKLDEIDKKLLQLREQGKTFAEIRKHFGRTTGILASHSTWAKRHHRIKDKERHKNTTDPLKQDNTREGKRSIFDTG